MKWSNGAFYTGQLLSYGGRGLARQRLWGWASSPTLSIVLWASYFLKVALVRERRGKRETSSKQGSWGVREKVQSSPCTFHLPPVSNTYLTHNSHLLNWEVHLGVVPLLECELLRDRDWAFAITEFPALLQKSVLLFAPSFIKVWLTNKNCIYLGFTTWCFKSQFFIDICEHKWGTPMY